MYFASEYVFRMQFKAPLRSSGLEGATFTHIHMHLCCLWSSDVEEQERKCSALSETTLSSLTHEHCRHISSLPVSIYTSASSVTQWATARRRDERTRTEREKSERFTWEALSEMIWIGTSFFIYSAVKKAENTVYQRTPISLNTEI